MCKERKVRKGRLYIYVQGRKNERIILRKIKKPELRECSKGESREETNGNHNEIWNK